MSILDSLTITLFSYWIKDLSLISPVKKKKKKKDTVYTNLSGKTTEKRVKNIQEKYREPITKFYSVWLDSRKENQTDPN